MNNLNQIIVPTPQEFSTNFMSVTLIRHEAVNKTLCFQCFNWTWHPVVNKCNSMGFQVRENAVSTNESNTAYYLL